MNFQKEYLDSYLSDEELNAMICEIESGDLVMAPPDIKENVLRKVANKKKEFVTYCFRVVLSAAAAITLMFLLPTNIDFAAHDEKIPTKQEVLAQETLNNRGFLEKLLDNIEVLKNNNLSAVIMNENGGK